MRRRHGVHHRAGRRSIELILAGYLLKFIEHLAVKVRFGILRVEQHTFTLIVRRHTSGSILMCGHFHVLINSSSAAAGARERECCCILHYREQTQRNRVAIFNYLLHFYFHIIKPGTRQAL